VKLNEQHLLELRCEFEELITEREGMLAENNTREGGGSAPAYGDEAFFANQKKMKSIRERIIRFGEMTERDFLIG